MGSLSGELPRMMADGGHSVQCLFLWCLFDLDMLLPCKTPSCRTRLPNPASPTATWRCFARSCSAAAPRRRRRRSEEHTSELQSQSNLVCRLLLEKKKKTKEKLQQHSA